MACSLKTDGKDLSEAPANSKLVVLDVVLGLPAHDP
jgi:hypothetical protein